MKFTASTSQLASAFFADWAVKAYLAILACLFIAPPLALFFTVVMMFYFAFVIIASFKSTESEFTERVAILLIKRGCKLEHLRELTEKVKSSIPRSEWKKTLKEDEIMSRMSEARN